MAVQIDGTSGISGVDGSASTPALQGSDTNTGISFGTDTVNVVTGGSTRTTVDSSGRLLVGTSSSRDVASGGPSKVQIEDSNFRHLSMVQNSNDDNGVTLAFGKSRGTSAGGTTIVQNNDDIANIRFAGANGSDVTTVAAQIRVQVDGTPGTTNDMPGRVTFWTTADAAGSPTERARITSSGHFKATNSGDYFASGAAVHELRNSTGNNEIAFLSHTASSGPYGINIRYTNAAPNGSDNFFFYARDSSALRAQITSNGGLQNYQSNNVNLCDEREKKNIVSLDSTWDCLKHWDLKKFHYNEDADDADLRYGVIAQQVAPHCPEVITEWVKQKAEDAVLDDDGNVVTPAQEEIVRMGVKEQQMMWMAIKALQEAQTRIEQLETRVAQLEGGAS